MMICAKCVEPLLSLAARGTEGVSKARKTSFGITNEEPLTWYEEGRRGSTLISLVHVVLKAEEASIEAPVSAGDWKPSCRWSATRTFRCRPRCPYRPGRNPSARNEIPWSFEFPAAAPNSPPRPRCIAVERCSRRYPTLAHLSSSFCLRVEAHFKGFFRVAVKDSRGLPPRRCAENEIAPPGALRS